MVVVLVLGVMATLSVSLPHGGDGDGGDVFGDVRGCSGDGGGGGGRRVEKVFAVLVVVVAWLEVGLGWWRWRWRDAECLRA